MTWLWISAPIGAVFFLGYTVIPIWLGFRYPDTGPEQADRVPSPHPANPATEAAAGQQRLVAARR